MLKGYGNHRVSKPLSSNIVLFSSVRKKSAKCRTEKLLRWCRGGALRRKEKGVRTDRAPH